MAVTDHAAERYRQRVGTRTGSVDVKPEIVARVSRAFAAGRTRVERGVAARAATRSSPGVVYVCRHDRDSRELLVVTLWEEGEDAQVPSRFTNALQTRRPPRPRPAGSVSSEDPAILGAMPALGAILTAIITPFDADGRVDEDAFVAVQQHVCATGSDGVVVAGTTGEAPTLSDEEHLRIIELAVAQQAGGQHGGRGHRVQRHAPRGAPHRARDGARRRRDPVRHAVLQPPDAARDPGALRRGRQGDRSSRSSSTTSPRARAPTCPTSCSPSSRSSTA